MNPLGLIPPASDTLAIWVAIILAQITGVVMLATVTARTWARFHPALRHGIWLGSLLAVLASPLLAAASIQGDWSLVKVPLLGAERPAALPNEIAAPDPGARSLESSAVLPAGTWADIDLEPTGVESTPTSPTASDLAPADLVPSVAEVPFDAPRSLFTLLLALWGAGSLFLASRLAHGAWVLANLRRDVQPADVLTEALDLVRERLPGEDLPRVVVSDVVHGPVAAGVWNPIVVIPLDLAERLSPAALADVLMHECAHLVERHPWSGFLSRVAVMLFWPHPLVHYLASQLARAREEVCDNYVLSAGSATGYARTLLALTPRLSSPAPHPAAALGLLEPTWKLEDRVAGLLNPRRKTMIRVPRWQALAVVATLAVVALGVAATRFVNAEESPAETSALAFADDAKKPNPLAEVAVVADSLHLPLRIVDRFDYVNAITEPLNLPALAISEEPQNDRATMASSFARGTFKPASPRAGKSTIAWISSPPISGGFDWRPVAVTREGNRITVRVEEWTDSVRRLQNHQHQTIHAVSLGVLPAETYEFRIQVQTMFWDAANKARHYEDTKLVQGSIKLKLGDTPAENVPLPSLSVKDLEPREMLAKPVPRSWQNPRPVYAELFGDNPPAPGVRVGTFDLAAWQKLPGQKSIPDLKAAAAGDPVYAVVVGPQFNLYESMRLASIEWIDQRAILRMEMWRDEGSRRKNYNFYPMTIVPLVSHEGEASRGGDYQVDLAWTLMYASQPGGVATASTRDQIVQRGGEPGPVHSAFAAFVAGAANSVKFSIPAKQAGAPRANTELVARAPEAKQELPEAWVQLPRPIAWQFGLNSGKKAPAAGLAIGTFDPIEWEKQTNKQQMPQLKPPAAGQPVYAVFVGPQLDVGESMHVGRIEWTGRNARMKMVLRRDQMLPKLDAPFTPVIAVALEPNAKAVLAPGEYRVQLDWVLDYGPFQKERVRYAPDEILKDGRDDKAARDLRMFAEFGRGHSLAKTFTIPPAKNAEIPAEGAIHQAQLTLPGEVAAAPNPNVAKLVPGDITMQLEAQATNWTADSSFELRCTVTNNTSKAITFPGWGMMDVGEGLEVVDAAGQAVKFEGYRLRTAKESQAMFPTIDAGKSHVFKLSARIQGASLLKVEERQGGFWTWPLVPGSSYKIRAITATEGKAEQIKKQFVFARADNLWTGKARSNEVAVKLAQAEADEVALVAAPAKERKLAPADVSMQLAVAPQWVAGGTLAFQCTVTNNTAKAITFPAWGMLDISEALEVLDAQGQKLKFDGGRDRTAPPSADMFPTIEAGKSHVFKLSGRVTDKNMLILHEVQGGLWSWNLTADSTYTIRAVAMTEGRAEEIKKHSTFARVENLWTGKAGSNELKVTLGAPKAGANPAEEAAEPKQAFSRARLTEIAAAAPNPAAPRIVENVTMQLEAPVAWSTGDGLEFQCTVKNNSDKAIVFPIWNVGFGPALEVLDADGKVVSFEGGNNRGQVPGPNMFTTIDAGKSQTFKVAAQVNSENHLVTRYGSGGIWYWKLSPGKFTVRAVASYDDKHYRIRDKFPEAQRDKLWNGRIRSNDLKVTLAAAPAKAGEPKQAALQPDPATRQSLVQKFNEIAKAPEGNIPAIPAADVTLSLEAKPTDWAAGGKLELICTVKNNGKSPIVFPGWGMMDISYAVEVVAADGRVLPWGGGRDATRKASADMFPTIEPGKAHVFKIPGSVDASNLLILHEQQGGVWTTSLKPGEYTIRAVALTAGKAEDLKKRFSFARVDNLWTGTLRSSDVKVRYAVGEAKNGANDPPKKVEYGPESRGFRSRISLEKPKFAAGEAIRVKYAIKNVVDRTQLVWHAGFWPNHMILVKNADGSEASLSAKGKQCREAFAPDGARDKNAPVAVNAYQEDTAWEEYDLRELYDLKAGKYTVQYVYEDRGRVESNVVAFEVAGE